MRHAVGWSSLEMCGLEGIPVGRLVALRWRESAVTNEMCAACAWQGHGMSMQGGDWAGFLCAIVISGRSGAEKGGVQARTRPTSQPTNCQTGP